MKRILTITTVLFLALSFGPQFIYAQQQVSPPPGRGWCFPCSRMDRGDGMMCQGMERDRMGPAARLNGETLIDDDSSTEPESVSPAVYWQQWDNY